MTKVYGVTGWKNSGKTTLVSKLVAEFSKRGLVVSTIKHAHNGFAIDTKGTDSYAHRQAGAHEVVLVSDNRWALMHEARTGGESPTLDTMLKKIAPCDLVLVEGFKNAAISKIECIRGQSATNQPVWKNNDTVRAIATDTRSQACEIPQFDIDDIPTIADYIAQMTGLGL